MNWHRSSFTIDTDSRRLNMDVIHGFLRESYWAQCVPREIVERAVENSLNFGLYEGDRQIGFARVITDRTTFAYLAGVFVLPPYRGRGLSKWLMDCVMAHPDLRGLRRFMLATKDAHGLYEKYGFRKPSDPDRLMEIVHSHPYSRQTKT